MRGVCVCICSFLFHFVHFLLSHSQSLYISCHVGAFLLCSFELLTDWMLERKAFNRLALGPSHPLLSRLVCSVAAAFCPSHGSVRKGGGWVRAHAHVALSVSMHCKVSQAQGMRSSPGKLCQGQHTWRKYF